MIRNTPFHIDERMRTAKAVKNSAKPKHEGDSGQTAEADEWVEKSQSQSPRPLYDLSIAIQQSHLLD